MRFLVNENLPLPSIGRLREVGHDVAAVSEDSPGVSDREVLARAALERRILLTFDRDYGALVYHYGLRPPAGATYFRFMPRSPEEPADRLLVLLAVPALILEGRFTVLEPGQARQRALPEWDSPPQMAAASKILASARLCFLPSPTVEIGITSV
jgi:hypothetical protein